VVTALKAALKSMKGLRKEQVAQDQPPFPSEREPAMLSQGMDESLLSEGRDRKLRNQLILANIVAWIVIGLLVRYLFF